MMVTKAKVVLDLVLELKGVCVTRMDVSGLLFLETHCWKEDSSATSQAAMLLTT